MILHFIYSLRALATDSNAALFPACACKHSSFYLSALAPFVLHQCCKFYGHEFDNNWSLVSDPNAPNLLQSCNDHESCCLGRALISHENFSVGQLQQQELCRLEKPDVPIFGSQEYRLAFFLLFASSYFQMNLSIEVWCRQG